MSEVRINLKTRSRQSRANSRRAKRAAAERRVQAAQARTPYVACAWDDVAFKPTEAEPKFCSARCRKAQAQDKNHSFIAAEYSAAPFDPIIYPSPLLDFTPVSELFRIEHGETPEPPVDEWDAWELELKMRSVDHYTPRKPRPWPHTPMWSFVLDPSASF